MEKNAREYRVNRRVERIQGSDKDRQLYRVVLEPDDDSPFIIATFEALEQQESYRFRPILGISFVRFDTNEPVSLKKEDLELAAYKVVQHLVEENPELEEEYLDDKPAW
jgi:hypothetical protein